MLICFYFIFTNRVEQHSADILPIAVLQTRPAELTFGPHTEPTATDRLRVQSLLPALVTRAALQRPNAHGLWQTPRGWRISTAIPTWACWSAPSPCPRSCLCCGMLCCPGRLLWSHRLTSGQTGSFSHCDSSFSSAAICPPVRSQHRQHAKLGAQHFCEIIDSWTRYSKSKQLTLCKTDAGLLAAARCRSHTHTLSNVSTSTFLGLLQGRGSLFSSTAKFSGGRALRDGFLRSKPPPDSNLRFRGVAFSLFFCRDLQNLVDNLLTTQTCWTGWSNVEGVCLPTWGVENLSRSVMVLKSANSLAS